MGRDTMQIEGMTVLVSSITATGIGTADLDDKGYLVRNGTNRGISHAITPDGDHLLYMTTNGDDRVIPDDLEEAREVCQDLGDEGPGVTDLDRQRQGAGRILAAVATMQGHYGDNEAAQESLEWYADKAREVLAAVKDDEVQA